MTVDSPVRQVALVVTNPQQLHRGSTPHHIFDRSGGTIGCRGANWILADRAGQIEPIHCEIRVEDGAFCIVDRCGSTRINNNDAPLGHWVVARLGDGDMLHVGPYRIAVHLHDQEGTPDASRHLAQLSVGDILNERDARLAGLDALPPEPMREASAGRDHAAFQALTEPLERREDLDPLLALDAAERRAHATPAATAAFDPVHYGLGSAPTQANLSATRFEAVAGAPHYRYGEPVMPQQRTDSTEARAWAAAQHGGASDLPQLLAPLLQGLGVSLAPLDGDAAYRLLLEAGQTLRAAIEGLTALYQDSAKEAQRLSLLGRALQPIEDNPLRLGLGYEDTVRALFSTQRSVVHLAPVAAIGESLAETRRHNEAVVQAIGAGLLALLQAFSPALLLERFRRYRPDQATHADDGDWAWQMYTHYYNELTSSRQQGFDRLFWEVFEQAYDRTLRTQTP